MHEMSITRSILDVVKKEMADNKVTRLKSVRVKVGELTAVEPETLRFCFEACVKDTPMEGAALEIEEVPLTGKCLKCGKEFRMQDFVSVCPGCGGKEIEKTQGEELDIISMEAE